MAESRVTSGEDAYEGLRGLALDAVALGLPDPDPDPAHPSVSGVVVDIPAQGGFATLVAMTDGTTTCAPAREAERLAAAATRQWRRRPAGC